MGPGRPFTWEPSKGSQPLPRPGSGGQSPPSPTRFMGTLKGFPTPPAPWLRRAKPALAYAIHGNPQRVPNPSRALAPAGKARPRLRDSWEPSKGSQPLPRPGSGGQSPPSPTRFMGTLKGFPTPPAPWLRRAKPALAYAIHGNPQRVPKPSRALAPAGKARPRLRDSWEPSKGSQPLPRPGSGGQSPPSPTRFMGTLKGFPFPPRALAPAG